MEQSNAGSCELPTWQLVVGSVAIGGHLLAVLAMILAVPSGPWPASDGSSLSTPPQFAYTLNNLIPNWYLRGLGMAQHYHHVSNNPALVGVSIELRLEGADGSPLGTLPLPDPRCNWWVGQRQALLARALADDVPVFPPEGEMIAAPGLALPSLPIWELSPDGGLELRNVPEHLIPRERPVFRPSDKSLLLARSMARYARRTFGAARVEVIRRTQEPISPAVMFLPSPPAGGATGNAAGELVSNFGKFAE